MEKLKKLHFGSAGIPISTKKRNTLEGIKECAKIGLDAMELEFVHGVNITEEKAEKVKKTAKQNNIKLTAHAPYYVNLNSEEKPKAHASVQRIAQSAKILGKAEGWSVVFHPGFYMKKNETETYKTIKKYLEKILEKTNKQKNKVWIRPELMGKLGQFGSLKEIIKLSQETEGVLPTIDYAHVQARSIGKDNNYQAFRKILETLEKELGKQTLNNMHIHVAGVEYTEKGEKKHLPLKKSTLKYKEIVKTWKEFNIKGIVISESPDNEKDALILKKIFEKN